MGFSSSAHSRNPTRDVAFLTQPGPWAKLDYMWSLSPDGIAGGVTSPACGLGQLCLLDAQKRP